MSARFGRNQRRKMRDQMAIREASLNGRIAEQSRIAFSLRRALDNSVIIDVDLLRSREDYAVQMRATIEAMHKTPLRCDYKMYINQVDRSLLENDKLIAAIAQQVARALTEAAANKWRNVL